MFLRLSISLLCDVTLYEFATVSSSILPWMDMYIVSNFVDYEQCGSEHLDNWSCVHIHLSKSEFVTQDAGMSSSSDGGSEGRLY